MKWNIAIYAHDHPELAARSIASLPSFEKRVIVYYHATSTHLESLFRRLKEIYPGTELIQFGKEAEDQRISTPALFLEAGFEPPHEFFSKLSNTSILFTSKPDETWNFERGESPLNILGAYVQEIPSFVGFRSYEIFRATFGEGTKRIQNAEIIELPQTAAAFRKRVECNPSNLPKSEELKNKLSSLRAVPKVSVILPSFGRHELLKRALISLIEQDETSWEAVIVTSHAEVNEESFPEIAKDDPRFIIIPVDKKIPVSTARNIGLENAKGEFVAYLDNDDLFLSNHLSSLLAHIKDTDSELVYSICARMWEEGVDSSPIGYDLPFVQQSDWINLLVGNKFPTPAVFHRASKNYRFDESLECIEDWDLWLRISKGKKLSFLPQVTSLFSRRPNNEGFSSESKLLFHWYAFPVWAKHLNSEIPSNFAEEFKKILDAHAQQLLDRLPEALLDASQDTLPKNKEIVISSLNVLHSNHFLSEAKFLALKSILSPKSDSPINIEVIPSTLKASIVIPLYNGLKFTKELWDSIIKYPTKVPSEYVFVDNASTDGTQEWLKSIESQSVQIILNKENRNFSGACNQGAIYGRGEFIIFLNNDTLVTDNWLEPMLEEFQNESVGIVGNKELFPGTRRIHHAGIYIDLWHHPKHYLEGVLEDDPRVNFRRSCIAVTGACFAIRRSEFLELGGFYEGYKNGYEDVDLCLKMKSRKKECIYTPKSFIYHHVSKSAGRTTHSGANWELFIQRNGPRLEPDLVKFTRDLALGDC